jgi:hypothetical protein
MHPILGYPRRLGLYLFAWLILSELLFYVVTFHSGVGWFESAAFFFPLCILYGFVCLSAWYSCRGIPIEGTSFSGLVFPHLLAAIVVSIFWLALAKAMARILSNFPRFQGFDRRIAGDFRLLPAIGVLLYLLVVALFYVLLAQEASREAEQRRRVARTQGAGESAFPVQ